MHVFVEKVSNLKYTLSAVNADFEICLLFPLFFQFFLCSSICIEIRQRTLSSRFRPVDFIQLKNVSCEYNRLNG